MKKAAAASAFGPGVPVTLYLAIDATRVENKFGCQFHINQSLVAHFQTMCSISPTFQRMTLTTLLQEHPSQ